MPRKPVYISTQSPGDLMSGLLEIMQSQSGDNHLTVSCMRAMNKYLTTNLRQSTARFRSRDSNRSTHTRLCIVCGLRIANTTDKDRETQSNITPQAVPGSNQAHSKFPQSANHSFHASADNCDHQDYDEYMQIDDNSGEAEQDAVSATDVPIHNGTRVSVPHNVKQSFNAPEEANDQHSNKPPQTGKSGAQLQSDSIAESTSGPVTESVPAPITRDTPSFDTSLFQGLRDVNQSFYVADDSDSPIEESSQPLKNYGLRSNSSPVPEPESSIVAEAESSAVAEPTIPDTAVVTEPKSSSVSKTVASPGRTPFGGPRNVTQSFCAFPDSDSDASSEASSQSPQTPRNHGLQPESSFGPKAGPSAGRTPFGGPRNISQSFCAPDDPEPLREKSPELEFGSSPPVMSDTPCNRPARKRSIRDISPPAGFYHADSSDHGSGEETEGGAKKDANKDTVKDKGKDTKKDTEESNNRGYRIFLELIKKSLKRPFNLDETLTETDLRTSSPSHLEKEKEKEKEKQKGEADRTSFVSDKTEEDTEEDTDLEDVLIARGMIKPPSKPDKALNLPAIIITNTDINSSDIVDYQKSIDHTFGLRFKRCKARAPKVDTNFLTIPKPDTKPKSTLPARNKRKSTSPAREQREPKSRRIQLSRPPQATVQQREERARRRGSLKRLTSYPITGDKRKREENYEIDRTSNKVRFAFGTKEYDRY